MSNLNISNVITVSVAQPPGGVADYQVNNLGLFTKDVPINGAITAGTPGIYIDPAAVLTDFGVSETYSAAVAIFSQTPNILSGGGSLIIFPMADGDALATSIPAGLAVQFFGAALYAAYAPNNAEIEAAAAVCETPRVKFFVSAYQTSALTPTTGLFDILHTSNLPHTRKLLYTQAGTALGARLMAAAYASRAMSVDFAGTATTNTMHLKQLVGVLVDNGIDQTNLGRCATLGVDVYVPISGRASVFTSGADSYFDDVYNLDWLVFALQVAGFNALAETSTKLPQTEPGIAVLRNAYATILKLAVQNGYFAPGQWNSPQLFGNPADLIRNIAQVGWYIYSNPVNSQTQAQRVARQAPLIQIAGKEAGAVHSSAVVVYINQ